MKIAQSTNRLTENHLYWIAGFALLALIVSDWAFDAVRQYPRTFLDTLLLAMVALAMSFRLGIDRERSLAEESERRRGGRGRILRIRACSAFSLLMLLDLLLGLSDAYRGAHLAIVVLCATTVFFVHYSK
jgi:hypothetical protein